MCTNNHRSDPVLLFIHVPCSAPIRPVNPATFFGFSSILKMLFGYFNLVLHLSRMYTEVLLVLHEFEYAEGVFYAHNFKGNSSTSC